MSEILASPAADKVVDTRSRPCPGPMLEARKAIETIGVGQTLEILSSDGGSLEDIPAWCRKTGQEYVGHVARGGYTSLYVVRRR